MHLPKFSILGSRHSRFTGLHATLMNFSLREMSKVKFYFTLVLFEQLFYYFMSLCAGLTFIIAKFHKGDGCIFIAHEHIPGFDDNFFFFFKSHDYITPFPPLA